MLAALERAAPVGQAAAPVGPDSSYAEILEYIRALDAEFVAG